MTKRVSLVLVFLGFLWAAGCSPDETKQTPSQGSVIGHGALNFSRAYADSSPTTQQSVSEAGSIPFEIHYEPDGAHEVEGKGVVTLNHEVTFTTIGSLCVFQAIANVEAGGELFEKGESPFVEEDSDPEDPSVCSFDFTLKFNYPKKVHLISGDANLCGEFELQSTTVEIQGMKAVNGAAVRTASGGLNEEIVLANLEINGLAECTPPLESDLK